MRNINTTNTNINTNINTIIDNTIITHINNIILPDNILDNNQPINQDDQHEQLEEQIVL